MNPMIYSIETNIQNIIIPTYSGYKYASRCFPCFLLYKAFKPRTDFTLGASLNLNLSSTGGWWLLYRENMLDLRKVQIQARLPVQAAGIGNWVTRWTCLSDPLGLLTPTATAFFNALFLGQKPNRLLCGLIPNRMGGSLICTAYHPA